MRVPSIHEKLRVDSTSDSASSRDCMSSMIIKSGRTYLILRPRGELPAPIAARITGRPLKKNFLRWRVSFSSDNLQLPKRARMLGLSRTSTTSLMKFSASCSVLQQMSTNLRSVNRTVYTTINFRNTVFAKPRGKPIASRCFPRSIAKFAVIHCHRARKIFGNRYWKICGTHIIAKKLRFVRAASILSSLLVDT